MQDLARGYWQVPVKQEDQHKTAFTTPYGCTTLKSCLLAYVGHLAATFQGMMDQLLRGAEEHAAAYVDDFVDDFSSSTANVEGTHLSSQGYPYSAKSCIINGKTWKMPIGDEALYLPRSRSWLWTSKARAEQD